MHTHTRKYIHAHTQHPSLWTVYAAFMVSLSMTTGIAFALTRAAILMLLSLFNVFRIDHTVFPATLASLDSGFSAFMGVQMLWHRHHSPVLHAVKVMFFEGGGGDSGAGEGAGGRSDGGSEDGSGKEAVYNENISADGGDGDGDGDIEMATIDSGIGSMQALKHKRIRNRWQVALTLQNNPSLAAYRKSAILNRIEGKAKRKGKGAADEKRNGNGKGKGKGASKRDSHIAMRMTEADVI